MAVVKESVLFDWIRWLLGMWEGLPFCIPLSLLILQPNVHIQQFCLAGNRDISESQRLLSWQLRGEHGVASLLSVFFSLCSHRGNWMEKGKIKLFMYRPVFCSLSAIHGWDHVNLLSERLANCSGGQGRAGSILHADSLPLLASWRDQAAPVPPTAAPAWMAWRWQGSLDDLSSEGSRP